MSWRVAVRMRLGTLDLDVDVAGDRAPVALIGPNGSGKTTLLRTIAGAYRPDGGTITLGGRVVFDAESGVDQPAERRRVGYVPQGYGLFPHLDVLDNVAFGWLARAPGGRAADRRRAATVMLADMGAAHLAHRLPAGLSGGEQQRVALARALTAEPALLLLDEPLAALDAAARRSVRRYLADHLDGQATPAIVVSHDERDVRALGGDVIVLEAGRVVQKGTADALRASPATEFVAAFFEVEG